ncbi:hypothetical protein DB30_02478 [Enhygromyxa salina]|uniref:Regulator of chromosome condensation (RCC1) repeat protein n=1 Tax=Enhygromyxa salina TaxID=215803 RepID=A0A0C2D890_9BACT|nr:hypothetical protein [Enhygromyxa salina]KIG17855.1 hypothetical protein DB30_02478 [Enhygromyxa salina]
MQHAKTTMALAGILAVTAGCSVPFCEVYPENEGCPGFAGESGESETANPSETGDGDGDGDSGDGDGDPGDGDGDPGDGDGDPGCTELGCMCDGTAESCDPGLICEGAECVPQTCGNGTPDDGEACDDGNEIDGDGCDTDCTWTTVEVVAGAVHNCALIEGGRLRCWGGAYFGGLGYGNLENIGDDETPASAGDVTLPGDVVVVDPGWVFTCALFEDELTRCWGVGYTGQLGNGTTIDIGDDEMLGGLPGLMLGGTATHITSGGGHSCARFGSGDVRCWGYNGYGQLGTGNTTNIGDDEPAIAAGLVDLGPNDIALVAAGNNHSCAVTNADDLYCWGLNTYGQLGYGNVERLGDDEPPSSNGPVDVYPAGLPGNTSIVQLALGGGHTCALFSTGDVLCWGSGSRGQLGQANIQNWGDEVNEAPGDLTPIELGGTATAISAGESFSCALLDNGDVRCWGRNADGQLGLGLAGDLGDDEFPIVAEPIVLGGAAISISSGDRHSCAVREDYSVVCWGFGEDGRLGYGNTNTIGDDETPASAGSIDLL